MFQLAKSRLLWVIPTLLVVSFLVFAMLDLAPGDAAADIAGPNANAEQIEVVRRQLHLDAPLYEQYGRWLTRAIQGDFGNSLVARRPVSSMVLTALPISLSMIGLALVFAVFGALVLSTLPALVDSRIVEKICTLVAALSIAMPSFWLALILIQQFATRLNWFPAIGYVSLTHDPAEWFRHMVLPAVALGLGILGTLARQLQGALQDVLQQDYVVSAYAKGLRRPRVVLKHALKNAAVPAVTILGASLGQLVGSTVLIERIFVINGVGGLAVTAVTTRDIPVVLGVVVLVTLVVLVANSLVDVSLGYFNPKTRAT